jgi:catechol 2,3-dioxygenase-like lactoylglutathione lyase family enzyme
MDHRVTRDPDNPDTYSVHPPSPRWTHVALRVNDIDATIAWYTEHTPLKLLTRREDEAGYGAWLGHDDNSNSPFVLVVSQFFEGMDPFASSPHTVLGPFAHLGIELCSRDEINDAAATAEANGSLAMPPTQMPPPIGYICMARDPDGNTIEFSYDQGIYATAQEVWG